ncbi:hypothetical protein RB653_006708 [Dictyostelium firmibasis]|uniref:Uncharacterized protein n=1 Tax=Dictyostelium firmibasis TaxID=79012 RepID=A0AAN7TUP8_9MYCE
MPKCNGCGTRNGVVTCAVVDCGNVWCLECDYFTVVSKTSGYDFEERDVSSTVSRNSPLGKYQDNNRFICNDCNEDK